MANDERLAMVEKGSMEIAEACRFSGLGRTFLYMAMDRGELRYLKRGKRRLIPVIELQRFLADGLVTAK